MNTPTLHIARKWRSKSFDQMIGQELPIRMLKNSLYKSYYFPVYLFSGQRGCGKTTAARLFAAAINCELLPLFQEKPQETMVPCSQCASCQLIASGAHPDFIEIDAASHTGVEHVRALIDAATLLPTIGRKRVYLIDEAHMLSKAAFNAFLKILEEPPLSTLFIFATTDVQKIIETVRSRCFQLFFTPVEVSILARHLAQICLQERIEYEQEALLIIAKQAGGCVRDALNLLEQVRFSSDKISKEAVFCSLGSMSDEQILELMEIILCKKASNLLTFFGSYPLKNFLVDRLWLQLLEMLRLLILVRNNVADVGAGQAVQAKLAQLVRRCSANDLHAFFEELVTCQEVLARMTDQQMFFELFLLKLCERNQTNNNDDGGNTPAQACPVTGQEDAITQECSEEEEEEDDDVDDTESMQATSVVAAAMPNDERWQLFLAAIRAAQDPLVVSIFSQVGTISCDEALTCVALTFPKNLIFLQDLLDQTKAVWQPCMQKCYAPHTKLVTSFSGIECDTASKRQVSVSHTADAPKKAESAPAQASVQQRSAPNFMPNKQKWSNSTVKAAPVHDRALLREVADTSRWPKTNLVLRYFPGTVYARDLSA